MSLVQYNFLHLPERIEFTNTKMILHETGYLSKENGTWKYFYYLKDHVGSNRVVLDDQGGVVQINNFYPYGLTQAEPTPRTDQAEQPYKFGGKELDRDFGVDAYDFEARMYNPAIGRFMQPDPLAEKYYSISPYAYCGNNPVNRIDPNGMDWYVFGANDNQYQEKLEMEGTHRMAVKSVDKKGNITYKFYDFNDPDADAKAIDNGAITQFEIMSDAKVEDMIDASGVKSSSAQSSPWSYAKNEGVGKMDYGHRGVESGQLNKNTFYVRENTAYNLGDIGNYIWGRGMAELGFELGTARMGAHANNALFGRGQGSSLYDFGPGTYGAPSLWDSPGDQRAIVNGYTNSPAGRAMVERIRIKNEKIRSKWNQTYKTSFSIY